MNIEETSEVPRKKTLGEKLGWKPYAPPAEQEPNRWGEWARRSGEEKVQEKYKGPILPYSARTLEALRSISTAQSKKELFSIIAAFEGDVSSELLRGQTPRQIIELMEVYFEHPTKEQLAMLPVDLRGVVEDLAIREKQRSSETLH